MTDTVTIYIYLLHEGTDVWRPVEAIDCGQGTFRITSRRDNSDEQWQFDSGDVVRCELRALSKAVQLVAVELIQT